MRVPTVLALSAAMLAGSATAAGAHAELVPYQLPPGGSSGMVLMVTHGCGDEDEWLSPDPMDEAPTTAVTLMVPSALTVTPYGVEGWTMTTEVDDRGEVTQVRWDLDDPAGTTDTVALPLEVTLEELPHNSVVWLPVVQDCLGDQLSWTQEGEVRGGDEIPAMRLLVDENAATRPLESLVSFEPQPGAEAEPVASATAEVDGEAGLDVGTLLGIAVGLAGVAAVAWTLRRRRRT